MFDGSLVADGACVLAIGSHETDRRELDSALMGRSAVFVECTTSALAEAGDVTMGIADGTLNAEQLTPIREVLLGRAARAEDRPNVFKGNGMSWQDLVVAAGVPTGSRSLPAGRRLPGRI